MATNWLNQQKSNDDPNQSGGNGLYYRLNRQHI